MLKKRDPKKKPVAIDRIVDEVVAIFRSEASARRIEIKTRHENKSLRVVGNDNQIRQVFLNLIMNAADAVSSNIVEDRKIVLTTRMDENWVEVSVRDFCRGIDRERIGKILDPFFSTKSGGTEPAAKETGSKKQGRSVDIENLRRETYRSALGGIIKPLPETGDEARQIAALLEAPDDSGPLRLRQKASKSEVEALNASESLDDYRYLVFACHGVVPDSEKTSVVDQPALILSDPDPKTGADGFLKMADVFGLSLNADLVALSACSTGMGKSVRGEGVMGLTRAFMYAGTPAVTVTLWPVESMSAKDLNVGFFRNLKKGQARAEAIRNVKLSMIRGEFGEKWTSPYFWAPTVLFGDGGR